ncbi:hypothetical protein [Gelatiniphilus marinus]|uniref:Uncharacterized protein n=1 Tax=Gelatiniphilus marinus TaxID=1759464 RepID=A0ABW5JWA1_9FLAO
MDTNYSNICPSCAHKNYCVLTAQKDKVWSCSEFEQVRFNERHQKHTQHSEFKLQLV